MQTLFVFREVGMEEGKIQGEWIKVHDIQKREKLLAAGYS